MTLEELTELAIKIAYTHDVPIALVSLDESDLDDYQNLNKDELVERLTTDLLMAASIAEPGNSNGTN